MFTQADVDYVNQLLKCVNLPEDAALYNDNNSIVIGNGYYQFDKFDSGINVFKEYVIHGGYHEPDFFDAVEIHSNAPSLFDAIEVIVIDHVKDNLRGAAEYLAEKERWAELDKAMAEQDVPF